MRGGLGAATQKPVTVTGGGEGAVTSFPELSNNIMVSRETIPYARHNIMVILRPHGFFRRYHILLCKFESDVCIVLCRYSARACVEGLMVHNIIKIVRMRTDRGGLQKCVTVTGGGGGAVTEGWATVTGGGGSKSRKKV
jgi:hypothetical protein